MCLSIRGSPLALELYFVKMFPDCFDEIIGCPCGGNAGMICFEINVDHGGSIIGAQVCNPVSNGFFGKTKGHHQYCHIQSINCFQELFLLSSLTVVAISSLRVVSYRCTVSCLVAAFVPVAFTVLVHDELVTERQCY